MNDNIETAQVQLSYAKCLRRMRKDKKMTQLELSRRSGLERTFISDLERFRKVPSLTTMTYLAAALGTTLVEMLQGAEK